VPKATTQLTEQPSTMLERDLTVVDYIGADHLPREARRLLACQEIAAEIKQTV
jgi:hypothetical protein